MSKLKVGDYTNAGYILWIDDPSPLIPSPLVKVSSTNLVSHRLDELYLVEKPKEEERQLQIPLAFKLPQDELLRLLTRIITDFQASPYGGERQSESSNREYAKRWMYHNLGK